MDLYVSLGNRKVRAIIWNLPVGSTCKTGTSCRDFCYALKAERAYKHVRPRRKANYEASKLKNFSGEMVSLLSKKKLDIVRIHESGDFYSKEYARKWYEICMKLPKKDFYAYTKRDDIFGDMMLATKPDNLTVIWSVDGVHKDDAYIEPHAESWITKRRFDKAAIIRESTATCPHQTQDNITCMVDCKWCIDKTHDIIEFRKH